MAQDIVPALNEAIEESFKNYCLKDRELAQISQRIRDGTAKLSDGHDYAERLGENLSKALRDNLTADTLPNGTLYYNIATRTVTPALETNYNLVNEISSEIQKIIDEGAGIGLGSIKADFPLERIKGLIDKMAAEGISLEAALVWLGEPIINNSEAFFDDYVKANADFRSKAGLKATLKREVAPGCCQWCAVMAGSYDYDSAPSDIYRRHEFCRCTVTYKSEKTSQNVWTKRTWQTPKETVDKRASVGISEKITPEQRLKEYESLKEQTKERR